MDSNNQKDRIHVDWDNYYTVVANNPPRDTVLRAIKLFEEENPSSSSLVALDIGCGSGRDTKALLAKNWSVLAVDGEQKGIDLLLRDVESVFGKKIKTQVCRFEELELTELFDLVNSSYALPFCRPSSFSNLWQKIVSSIKIGGRFSGQFFGTRDTWVKHLDMNFHSKEETKNLFKAFEFEFFLKKKKMLHRQQVNLNIGISFILLPKKSSKRWE